MIDLEGVFRSCGSFEDFELQGEAKELYGSFGRGRWMKQREGLLLVEGDIEKE